MGDMKSHVKSQSENLVRRDYLGDPGMNGRTTLM
jgi:hypothetical protein